MSNTLEDSLDKALDNLIDWILGHDEEELRNIDFRKAKNEVFYAIEPSILSQAHKIGLEAIGEDREYEKYGKCPSGCGFQYGCACDSAEYRIKNEQRQRLSKITGIEGSKDQ